jgi:taurine dioxygenase
MMPQYSLDIQPVSKSLGAEIINVDISQPLSASLIDEIHKSWLENLVLLFRNQALSDADLVAFSRNFGDLDSVPGWEPFSPDTHAEVLVVSNVQENGTPIGVLGDGEASWHTDMAYIAKPPPASLLYSLEVPDTGGDTCFMNMYDALDALPDDLRRAIEGKTLNHDSSHDSGGNLRPNHQMFTSLAEAPGARHPIIRKHPDTGRPALFLGRRLHAWIVGMDVAQSDALLDRLWEHCLQEDFTYRHEWQPGDLLMWDNRVTMHRRDPFDGGARRVMHRTQLKGIAGVEAAA